MITENKTSPLNTWNEYNSAINICSLLQIRRRYHKISPAENNELNILSERCRNFLKAQGTPELK